MAEAASLKGGNKRKMPFKDVDEKTAPLALAAKMLTAQCHDVLQEKADLRSLTPYVGLVERLAARDERAAVITAKCVNHAAADAIHLFNGSQPMCVPCVVQARQTDPEQAKKINKRFYTDAPLAQGGHAAKCAFTVYAGIIPEMVMPEFTEEWWITGEQWAALMRDLASPTFDANSQSNIFLRAGDEARWYSERITDPRIVNWVRTDFIYL